MGKTSSKLPFHPLIAALILGAFLVLAFSTSPSGASVRRKVFGMRGNSPPQFTDAPSEVRVKTGALCSFTVHAIDPDGSIPALTAFNLPSNASLSDHGDGSGGFTFTPNLSQVGRLTVGFVAADGELADTALVSLIVTEAPGYRRAPEFEGLPAELSLAVGAPTSLVVSASDPDGLVPSLSAFPLPTNASFVDHGDGSGVLSMTPTGDQVGRVEVTFVASDGVLKDTASVVLIIYVTDPYPPDTVQGVTFQADLIATYVGSGTIDQLRAEDLDGDGLAEVLFRLRPFGGPSRLEIWNPSSSGQAIPLPSTGGILGYSLRAKGNGVQPVLRSDSGQILVLNSTGTGWDSVATVPLRASQFQWVPENRSGWQICYEIGNGSSHTYTDPMGTCTYYRSASWSDTKFIGSDGSTTVLERLGIAGASPNGLRSLRQFIRGGFLTALLIPSASREDERKSGNCMPTHLYDFEFLLNSLQEGAMAIDTLRGIYSDWSPDFIGPYAEFKSYLIGLGEWHHQPDTSMELAYVDNVWPYMPTNSYTRWKMITLSLGRERHQTAAEFALQPYLSRGGITRIDADSSEVMIVAADSGLAHVLSIPDARTLGTLQLPRVGEFPTAYTMDHGHRDLIFKTGAVIEIYRVTPVVLSRTSPMSIRVPGDRPTIQSAINWAQHGDTVLVAPGKYVENIDFLGKRIVVMGFPDSTRPVLEPRDSSIVLVRFGSAEPAGTVFQGFTVLGDGVTKVVHLLNGADVTIRDNVFTHCRAYGSIIVCDAPSVKIYRNLFADNPVKDAVHVLSGAAKIINNTFDRNSAGITDYAGASSIRNNIITNSTAYGVDYFYYPVRTGALDYNNIWNNHSNYGRGPRAGAHDISFDPLYEDTTRGMYTLRPMSPCIDNGDPDSTLADPDGTTADIGAFPFIERTLPRAVHLSVSPAPFWRVTADQPIFRWTFFDTGDAHQTAYQFEVGTDKDWAIAEKWSTGEVFSGNSSVDYSGSILDRGSIFYYRVRVRDGGSWGNWAGSLFEMNALPTIPSPRFPIGGSRINQTEIQLVAIGSTDKDLDSLGYGFEVYSDSALTKLFATDSGRVALRDSVRSQILSGFDSGYTYWWRARAWDGYEYSPWSAPQSFRVRRPGLMTVPDDQATIQMGILAAADEDSILVRAGIYNESLDLSGRSLILVAVDGSTLTRIAAPDRNRPAITAWSSHANRITISGFSISGGSVGIDYHNASISITDNSISGNSFAIKARGGPRLTVQGNFIYDNSGWSESYGTIEVNSDSTFIRRNLIYGNVYRDVIEGTVVGEISNNTIAVVSGSGIHMFDGNAIVRNNIIFGAKDAALRRNGGRMNADYNCLFGNARNYYAVDSGVHDLLRYARFIDSTRHDYRLLQTSPCIDTGDPDTRFNDPDGSRSDIGAIPYFHSMSAAEHEVRDIDIIDVVNTIAKRAGNASAAPSAAELGSMIRHLLGTDSANIQLYPTPRHK